MSPTTTVKNAEPDEACFELARAAKWAGKPVDSEEIHALAKRLNSARADDGDATLIEETSA